jgi:hypothetical protein
LRQKTGCSSAVTVIESSGGLFSKADYVFKQELAMKQIIGVVASAAAALLLAACGSDSSSSPPQVALRVIHASPDAPDVNVLVDDAAVLSGVAYKEGSGYLALDEGTYDLAVEAITPAGNVVVIDLPGTALSGDTDYSVLAIGKVAASTLAPLILSNPQSAIPSGQVRVRVVHASPDAPEVDVYLTAPAADISVATPITLAFGEDAGPIEVAGGDYRVRATLVGDLNVLFDSGSVALPAGADLLVAAVTNTATGPAPISLIVNTGASQFEILDAATTADVRVGHVSPDAPAVDVVVDDNFEAPAVEGLTYTQVTPYLNLAPGAYNFKVVDSGTQTVQAIDLDATLAVGTRTSVFAVNLLATGVESLVLSDDPRSIATEARVRIVHGSPAAGPVDIYVTAPGTDIATVVPAFQDVPFKAETGYVSLAGGTYDVSVTPANDPSTVAIFASLPVAGGDVLTVIARDAPGGGAPLGVIVIDEVD